MFYKILLTLSVSLALSNLCFGEDKPDAPKFKPIPSKAELRAQESGSSGGSSNRPTDVDQIPQSFLDSVLDSSGHPLKSLRAHPPTSGREPMLLLGPKNKPMIDIVVHTYKLDYYDCQGVVAPWFREVLVAELNYFSEIAKIPMVDGVLCLVSVANENHLTPGRISVNFFSSNKEMTTCTTGKFCSTYRSVSMILKGPRVFRQYFLSDVGKSVLSQNCVTDKGKWYKNSTCYTVEE
jgi:hypothetical protein